MARSSKTMNYNNYENAMQKANKQRYSCVDLFSTEGRIGGQAYFVYSIILPFAFFWVLASIAGLVSKLGSAASIVSYGILTISAIVMFFIIVRLTIQRCHDFNASDKLAFLALIPFANIVFALIPGNNGLNSYGEAPEPASGLIKTGVKVLIVLLLAVAIFVILKSLGINLKDYLGS